jgi:hypothetical protein
MLLREFLLGELEAGRITRRQFRTRIRKACKEFRLAPVAGSDHREQRVGV